MSERLDSFEIKPAEFPSTMEGQENSLFLTGPAEFLCAEVAKALLNLPVWKSIFGEFIDPYKRMDYPIRALPALRIYNNSFVKTFDSWFIEGDLISDIIFPANIRRKELQQLPDSITAALLQQFRSPSFFGGVTAVVPGLNELGKRFSVDKSLAFEWGDDLVPLTQVTLNFRMDLRQWDLYLEEDNRTKDLPFERTLGDLTRIVTTIQGLRDEDPTSVEISLQDDQTI